MLIYCFLTFISIHAPARGATSSAEILLSYHPVNFNPRSREGSDRTSLSVMPANSKISIHAPARGATLYTFHGRSPLLISIHAPARGATSASCRSMSSSANFNPRSREGSDYTFVVHQSPFLNFNPRSREGSDTCGTKIIYLI